MRKLAAENRLAGRRTLHFAPEPFFPIQNLVGEYETADISGEGVQHKVDMCELPFPEASFDLVIACHVLEHIKEDRKALSSVLRILRPGGIAVLPVPIVSDITVEYPAPNRHEHFHVRAPGPDYYNRYQDFFCEVKVYSSADFDGRHQLWVHEDRTGWPTPKLPNRGSMAGTKHAEYIPVCVKA